MTTWVYVGSKLYPPGQEFVRALQLSTAKCPVMVSIPHIFIVFQNVSKCSQNKYHIGDVTCIGLIFAAYKQSVFCVFLGSTRHVIR